MAKTETQSTAPAFSANTWLARHGNQLVGAMFPDGTHPDDFEVTPLVHTPNRLVMKVSAGGKVKLVKAFNSDVPNAVAARYREIAVLLQLARTDLAPRVFAHNETSNWILSDFVESKGLGEVLTDKNAITYAKALGRWYGSYTDVMLAQATRDPSTWYEYLDHYQLLAKSVDYGQERDVLRSLPILQRVVAKNDAAFENFLVDTTGKLVGIDFEKAELKPYGWDILVTARLLVRHFPAMMLELTEALVDGWGQGTDCIDAEAMLKLTRIFSVTTAFTVTSDNEKRLRDRMNAFNAQADQPVNRIHETPYMHQDLVDQPLERAALLWAYLERGAIKRTMATPKAPGTAGDDSVLEDDKTASLAHDPSLGAAVYCGTCKGSCCQQGADSMAFLSPDVLDKARKTLNLRSMKAVIQHYVNLLPKQHIKDSCSFHGANGCTIPRDLRSETCNAFQCGALRGFTAAMGNLNDGARVLLFAGDESGPTRARVIAGTTCKEVDSAVLQVSASRT